MSELLFVVAVFSFFALIAVLMLRDFDQLLESE